MTSEESKVAVVYPAGPGHPISYAVAYPERLSRWKGGQRALGALITWIVSAGLGYVSAVFSVGLPFPFGPWVIIGLPIAFGVISVPLVLALRIRVKGRARFLAEDAPGLERFAARAMVSGEAASARISISRDLLMSQFWQKRQARLQPAVPNDSTGVPGRKWLSGFFSIGSTQKPLERP